MHAVRLARYGVENIYVEERRGFDSGCWRGPHRDGSGDDQSGRSRHGQRRDGFVSSAEHHPAVYPCDRGTCGLSD
jgi:hypothetical protein